MNDTQTIRRCNEDTVSTNLHTVPLLAPLVSLQYTRVTVWDHCLHHRCLDQRAEGRHLGGNPRDRLLRLTQRLQLEASLPGLPFQCLAQHLKPPHNGSDGRLLEVCGLRTGPNEAFSFEIRRSFRTTSLLPRTMGLDALLNTQDRTLEAA